MRWLRQLLCAHKFDCRELHRFDDDTVAGQCWKCNGVFAANCGLHLPGALQGRADLLCPTCGGLGKVHSKARVM